VFINASRFQKTFSKQTIFHRKLEFFQVLLFYSIWRRT